MQILKLNLIDRNVHLIYAFPFFATVFIGLLHSYPAYLMVTWQPPIKSTLRSFIFSVSEVVNLSITPLSRHNSPSHQKASNRYHTNKNRTTTMASSAICVNLIAGFAGSKLAAAKRSSRAGTCRQSVMTTKAAFVSSGVNTSDLKAAGGRSVVELNGTKILIQVGWTRERTHKRRRATVKLFPQPLPGSSLRFCECSFFGNASTIQPQKT